MIIERRTVGENSDRVVIDAQTAVCWFDNNGVFSVSDKPMQGSRGVFVTELAICNIQHPQRILNSAKAAELR